MKRYLHSGPIVGNPLPWDYFCQAVNRVFALALTPRIAASLKWSADAPTATWRTCLCKQNTRERATRERLLVCSPRVGGVAAYWCLQIGPNSVDSGTGQDSQIERAKRCVFSSAGGGWKPGFWHTRDGPLQTSQKTTCTKISGPE